MKNYNKIITGILSAILFFLPFSYAIAQTVGEETLNADTGVPTEAPVQTQDLTVLGDITSTAQVTILSDILVQTQDPNLIASEASSTLPIDSGASAASSTPDTNPIILEAPLPPPDTNPILDQIIPTDLVPIAPVEEILDIALPETQVVATMPVTSIAPKSSFKFAINSNRIATDKVPDWRKSDKDLEKNKKNKTKQIAQENAVTNSPDITLNATGDAPIVSGNCSDVYYVILMYKNETDYSKDPASYILNNAYPCVGGKYSFEINIIPKTIPDGTYYLLVGSMGNKGSWTPITSIVPIDIMH